MFHVHENKGCNLKQGVAVIHGYEMREVNKRAIDWMIINLPVLLRNWTTVAIVSCDTCKYKTSYTSLTEYTCTNKCQFYLQQIT